jgi:two-component system OmpR family response regulator
MRLLVVEDNDRLAESLTSLLRGGGHAVDRVASGEDADATLAAEAFDLVILDLGLPGMDGMDVLRRLRGRQAETAVLILTSRGALDDRVKGLNLGADDYLTKPFEIEEFEARVRALLRRRARAAGSSLSVGELSFDVAARTASLRGTALDLPRRELDLLEALMVRAGRVASKGELVEAISDFDGSVSENAIELYASRLRRKLEPEGVRIRALRGLGYMLEG